MNEKKSKLMDTVWVVALALLITGFFLLVRYQQAQKEATIEEFYQYGYDDGYAEGFQKGLTHGYDMNIASATDYWEIYDPMPATKTPINEGVPTPTPPVPGGDSNEIEKTFLHPEPTDL